jgi:hypothetical protein
MPKVLPGFNMVKARPQDVTHLDGCGLMRDELGKMIHNHVKINKLYTLPQLEAWKRRRVSRLRPPLPCLPSSTRPPLHPQRRRVD